MVNNRIVFSSSVSPYAIPKLFDIGLTRRGRAHVGKGILEDVTRPGIHVLAQDGEVTIGALTWILFREIVILSDPPVMEVNSPI